MKKHLSLIVVGLAFAFTAVAAKETTKQNIDTATSQMTWHGSKVTGKHHGKIKIKDGFVQWSGDTIKNGEFAIDMSSIVNEDIEDPKYRTKLETHLKSEDFFMVEKYPTSKFVITSAKPIKNTDGGANYEVTGKLTIKDKTHSVSFPAKIEKKDGITTATGSVTLDRTKWDVRYGSGKFFAGLGDKLIHDQFTLDLDLKAK